MAEQVVRVVWAKPRRRLGFGVGLALLLAAVVLLTGGLSATSQAAKPQHSAGGGGGGSPQAIASEVNGLMSRMTVPEKFGQLEMAAPNGPNGTPGDLATWAKNGEIGSVLDLTGVANIDAIQKAALQSRLHIPLIFGLDVIHGYKTMFPVPLAEASTWDPSAVENDEVASAQEATADGIKWTFNPMVDIARDPRWGRVVEGAGEDPYLGSAIAAAKVKGYQGTSFAAPDRMAATIKHFAGYGAPVAGREYNTVDMSTQQLFNDYLPPYKAAVDAGAATVMSSFNSLNGVPNTANPYTLQTILRDEWGFGGTTLSDYEAVQELEDFGYAANGAQAAQLALTAGVNIEMAVIIGPSTGNPLYSTYYTYGPRLLREGRITIAQLNNAVRHVLTLKFLAGMFSNPDPGSAALVQKQELSPAHLATARTTADESMVLLRNQNHALPLSKSTPSIAVVGPLADDPLDQLGPDVPIGYDTTQSGLTTTDQIATVVDGIKAADPGAIVNYQPGCAAASPITNGSPNGDADPNCTSSAGFAAAVSAARSAAVTVVVVGEPSSDTGEASSRTMLDLPGDQLQLIQQIAATDKPYVVVLMNGRPLTIDWLAANAPALLEAWYPGTEGGNAVADTLFGKVDPSGKLTMSFPVNTGQIPISYNELPTGRPYSATNKYTSKYLDAPNTPLYPFGYGLSYTTFSLSSPHLSSTRLSPHGQLTVTDIVTNTGSTAGTDVAQLYLHESDTTILQPVEKLEGFQRVTLNPNQSKTVTFKLGPDNLGYYDNQGQFEVEPGPFDLWVSDSSVVGTPSTFSVS